MNNQLVIIPKWNFDGKSTVLGIGAGAVVVLATSLYLWRDSKSNKEERKRVYIFCSLWGKPFPISESELLKIKQMKANGVLPSTIAKELNLSMSSLCIVINASNNL